MKWCVAGLAVAGLLAACGGNGTADADASRAEVGGIEDAGQGPGAAEILREAIAPADFEGTLRQTMLSLDADEVRKIVGSTDPAEVMAFPPEKLIDAVLAGEIQAKSIDHSTMEIDGRMARYQAEGDPGYSIIDGNAKMLRVVDPENGMVVTMDPAAMTSGDTASDLEVEHLGSREIHGFEAEGYRFDYFDGNVATVWLSPELEAGIGPVFDTWSSSNLLAKLPLGPGALVRSIMVNPEVLAGGRGFMPAYTLTEFHDLQPGPVSDERFALPEGYRQVDMADMAAAGMRGQ